MFFAVGFFVCVPSVAVCIDFPHSFTLSLDFFFLIFASGWRKKLPSQNLPLPL